MKVSGEPKCQGHPLPDGEAHGAVAAGQLCPATRSPLCSVTLADRTGKALKTLLALARGTLASGASDTRVKARRPNKSQSEAVSEDKADEAASSQPRRRTGSGKEQP